MATAVLHINRPLEMGFAPKIIYFLLDTVELQILANLVLNIIKNDYQLDN